MAGTLQSSLKFSESQSHPSIIGSHKPICTRQSAGTLVVHPPCDVGRSTSTKTDLTSSVS